jgi:hypothetical protein
MPPADHSGASKNEPSSLPAYCPNCGQPVRTGELVCTNCSYSLLGSAISSATKTLDRAEETFGVSRPKIGSAIRRAQKVAFIIDGDLYKLPPAQRLIIGRFDAGSDSEPPDVDLTPFGAADLGVSRNHIELTWKNDLIYISDTGSTNGTLLNGQRLMAGIERILRDNDELTIGHLRVIVRFLDN